MDGFAVGKNGTQMLHRRILGLRSGLRKILNLQFDSVSAGDFAEAFFGVVQDVYKRQAPD